MDFENIEVVFDLSPVLRVYKDGRVERISGSSHVPPTPEDSSTGVACKHINISTDIKARIYLPKLTITAITQKLPILVYYHGGGFCLESSVSNIHDNRYLNLLTSQANAISVSVEYRLAPEHPLPTGYEDSWIALQWVASHALENPGIEKEAWLVNHGDFEKVFIGGDSAGANIVHNMALRAGVHEGLNGGIKIYGGILSFPYFLSSSLNKEDSLISRMWHFVNPTAQNGIDDPKVNPLAENAPSLAGLGCSKLLVCVAEEDEARDLVIRYVEAVKKSGWKGDVELIDVEGEGHCFQIFDAESEKAKDLIKRIAKFIKQ